MAKAVYINIMGIYKVEEISLESKDYQTISTRPEYKDVFVYTGNEAWLNGWQLFVHVTYALKLLIRNYNESIDELNPNTLMANGILHDTIMLNRFYRKVLPE